MDVNHTTSLGGEETSFRRTRLPIYEVPTQEDIRTHLRSAFPGAIRVVLELVLEEELREMAGASHWERFGRAHAP